MTEATSSDVTGEKLIGKKCDGVVVRDLQEIGPKSTVPEGNQQRLVRRTPPALREGVSNFLLRKDTGVAGVRYLRKILPDTALEAVKSVFECWDAGAMPAIANIQFFSLILKRMWSGIYVFFGRVGQNWVAILVQDDS